MRKKPSTRSEPEVAPTRFRPNRIRDLMRSIKGELDAFQGRLIPYKDLAVYAGQAKCSVFDKLQKERQPQIEALLGWLERLPESTRNRLINSACRAYPLLESPQLAHDPTQVSHLRVLLRHTNGLTIIKGGDDGLRTFVATALGHSQARLRPEDPKVFGVDVHEPDWFIPIDQVIYLHNLLNPVAVRGNVHRHWPTLSRLTGSLVILNGVWSAFEGFDTKITDLCGRSHVVIADDMRFKPDALTHVTTNPIHLLDVSDVKDRRMLAPLLTTPIRVAIQQVRA